jgi:hypothetical protein
MAKKKKATLIAVREKVKKPRTLKLWGCGDGAEAWVDKTRLAGDRRVVFIDSLTSRDSKELRKIAEFCKQAADWMDDEK